MLITIHNAINTSRFNKPQCITKSAFDKNFNASATSIKAKTFFTVSNHPPLLGKFSNQLGKIANNAKGKPKATPNPAIPTVKAKAPPSDVPTNKVPKITPVQEKETITNVNAMKKIPMVLVKLLLESALPAMLCGSVISK